MTKTKIQFWNTMNALERSGEPVPENLLPAIQALPPVPQLLPPWTTWLMNTLLEYRKRQIWAKQVLCDQLPDYMPPNRLPAGWMSETLSLPALPQWTVEQFFSCGWVNLISRHSGECISVSVKDDNHLLFPRDFPCMLKPASRWQAASRLLELHPSPWTLTYAIDDLEGAGFLSPVTVQGEPESHVLTDLATMHSDQFQRLLKRWTDPNARLWCAALIGDWLAAAELARETNDDGLIMECETRAGQCRQERRAIARFGLDVWPNCHTHLHVLRDLQAEDADERLARWFERALGDQEAESQLARFCVETDDPKWCPQVFTLLEHACSCSDLGNDSTVIQCARFLVKHDYQVNEVIDAIRSRPSIIAEVAMLTLKQSMDSAIPIVRRALRAVRQSDSTNSVSESENWQFRKTSGEVNKTAALLAWIDEEWSRNELYDAVVELNANQDFDQRELLPIILALDASEEPEANKVATAWLSQYDHDMVEDARGHFRFLVDTSRQQFGSLEALSPTVSC